MSIEDLIQAAAFLERVEQIRENAMILKSTNDNYASKMYFNDAEDDSPPPNKRRRTNSFPDACFDERLHNSYKQHVNFQASIRPSHNELEKNRRANMRIYLEKLKGIVPLSSDANRHTTLTLLTKAVNHIQTLEEEEAKLQNEKNILLAHEMYLHQRMQLLTGRMTSGFYDHRAINNNNNLSPISCESSSSKYENGSNYNPQSPFDATDTSEYSVCQNALMNNNANRVTFVNQEAKNWSSKPSLQLQSTVDYEPYSKHSDNLNYLDNYQNRLNSFYSYYNYLINQPSNVGDGNHFSHDKKSVNTDYVQQPSTLTNENNDRGAFPWLKHFQSTVPYFNQFVYQTLMDKHFAPNETLEQSST